MKVHQLHVTGKKPRQRVGRGDGSGRGMTAGRGEHGQNSRSGGRVRPGFEGGQTALSKRLPKNRGFNKNVDKPAIVHTDRLNDVTEDTVDKSVLKRHGLIQDEVRSVKLLHRGAVNRPVHVRVDNASRNARAAIEDAGGTIGWQE